MCIYLTVSNPVPLHPSPLLSLLSDLVGDFSLWDIYRGAVVFVTTEMCDSWYKPLLHMEIMFRYILYGDLNLSMILKKVYTMFSALGLVCLLKHVYKFIICLILNCVKC